MVDLPKKKVGIVACSGEELPEGTVTRLAALRVLEELRPAQTVTICLPLYLAGGEGDRAFARFYPTVAVDGCQQRCAARATQMYSGVPAASLVVSELAAEAGLPRASGARRLDSAGLQAVELASARLASLVDELLESRWSRREGRLESQPAAESEAQPAVQATCLCGSGIPVQTLQVGGQSQTLIALPLIFEQLHGAGRAPSPSLEGELLDIVRVYNPIPAGQEEAYAAALLREYASYCRSREADR